jgi:predicted GNAT family acetyltransferase
MEIQHHKGGRSGNFELEDEGKTIAEMTYKRHNDRMIIDHTFVDMAYRGQGMGEKVLAAAIDFARQEHLGITPLCSFAKRLMERNPAYADVLE